MTVPLLWTVGDFAKHVGRIERTARRLVERVRDEHVRLHGRWPSWLSRDGRRAWYRINVELMREERPDLLRPLGIRQRVEACEDELEAQASRVDRLFAANQRIGTRLERLERLERIAVR